MKQLNRKNKKEKLFSKKNSKSIEISPKDFIPNIVIPPLELKQFYHNDEDRKDSYILKDCYYNFNSGTVRIATNSNSEPSEKRVVTKVYKAECEGDMDFTNEQRDLTVKELQSTSMVDGKCRLSPKNFFCIQMKTYKNSARNLLHLNFEFLFPSFFFQLKKVNAISLEETELLKYITSNETVSGRRKLPLSSGYLSLTKKRRLRLFLSDDEEAYESAICGFWIQHCPNEESVEFLVHLIRFILVKNFKEKVFQYGRSFLIVFFNQRNKPIFYNCRILGLKTKTLRYSIYNYRVEVAMMKNISSPLRVKFAHYEKQQTIVYTFPPSEHYQRKIHPNPSKSMSIPRNHPGPYRNVSTSSSSSTASPTGSPLKPFMNKKISSTFKTKNKNKKEGRPRSLPPSPALPRRKRGNGETLDLGQSLNIPSIRLGGNGGVQNRQYTEKSNHHHHHHHHNQQKQQQQQQQNYPNFQQVSWPKFMEHQRKYPHRYPMMFIHQPNSYYTIEKVLEEYSKLQNAVISSRDATSSQYRELREDISKEMKSMRSEHRDQMKVLKESISKELGVVQSKLEKIESRIVDVEIVKLKDYVKNAIGRVEQEAKNNHRIFWNEDNDDDDDDDEKNEIEFEVEEKQSQPQVRRKNEEVGNVQRREYYGEYIRRSRPNNDMSVMRRRRRVSDEQEDKIDSHILIPKIRNGVFIKDHEGGGKVEEEEEEMNNRLNKIKSKEEEINRKMNKNKNTTNSHSFRPYVASDISSPSSTTTFPEIPKIRMNGKGLGSTISSYIDDEDVDDIIGGVSSESGFRTGDFGGSDDDDDDDDEEEDSVFGS